MKQNKAVSVVMCTYNGASRHLREQLDSIFSQTVLPGEIVVQDDGSTDDTMAVLDEYARKAPDGVSVRIYQNATQQGIRQLLLGHAPFYRRADSCLRPRRHLVANKA